MDKPEKPRTADDDLMEITRNLQQGLDRSAQTVFRPRDDPPRRFIFKRMASLLLNSRFGKLIRSLVEFYFADFKSSFNTAKRTAAEIGTVLGILIPLFLFIVNLIKAFVLTS